MRAIETWPFDYGQLRDDDIKVPLAAVGVSEWRCCDGVYVRTWRLQSLHPPKWRRESDNFASPCFCHIHASHDSVLCVPDVVEVTAGQSRRFPSRLFVRHVPNGFSS
jgi:hypothetical protein